MNLNQPWLDLLRYDSDNPTHMSDSLKPTLLDLLRYDSADVAQLQDSLKPTLLPKVLWRKENKGVIMDKGFETIIPIAGKMVRIEVFDDKILFLDEDKKYEQRLDVLSDLKEQKDLEC